MPLPEFNLQGDMPPGIYTTTINEVELRFGLDGQKRRRAFRTLRSICERVNATGQLRRFILYGSFITAKPDPNDVDVFLVMSADFEIDDHAPNDRDIFSHAEADRIIGASVFWVTERLPPEMVEDFVQGWQSKREGGRRGIVEITE